MNTSKLRSIFLKVLLISVSVAALIGIIGILAGDLNDFAFKAGGTSLIFTLFSLGAICYLLPTHPVGIIVGKVGLVTGGIATLISLYFTWLNSGYGFTEEFTMDTLIISSIAAVAAAHICLLNRLLAEGWVEKAIWATSGISALLGLLFIITFLNEGDVVSEDMLAILSILLGLGTVVSLVGGIYGKFVGMTSRNAAERDDKGVSTDS